MVDSEKCSTPNLTDEVRYSLYYYQLMSHSLLAAAPQPAAPATGAQPQDGGNCRPIPCSIL